MAENHKPEVLKVLKSNAFNSIKQGRKHTHTFKVDYSDIHPDFVGTFTVHKPSVMEQINIGVIRAQLLGGITKVDVLTDNIATIVATLDNVLEEQPDWFDPWGEDLNYEILESVYTEYNKWYNNFRKSNRGDKSRGDSEDTGSDSSLEDNEGVQGSTD